MQCRRARHCWRMAHLHIGQICSFRSFSQFRVLASAAAQASSDRQPISIPMVLGHGWKESQLCGFCFIEFGSCSTRQPAKQAWNRRSSTAARCRAHCQFWRSYARAKQACCYLSVNLTGFGHRKTTPRKAVQIH